MRLCLQDKDKLLYEPQIRLHDARSVDVGFIVVEVPDLANGKDCILGDAGATLDCSDGRLTSLPANLLSPATTTILFGKNRLTSIPTAELATAPNLEVLDLTSNMISSITNDSFSTSRNLTTLYLDLNFALQEIEVGAFQHLQKLTKLSLKMTDLSTISPHLFDPLRSLEVLSFGFANITKPAPNLFAALTSAVEVEIASCGDVSTAIARQSLGLANLSRLEHLYVYAGA